MKKSETIKELCEALSKAQGEIGPASFDKRNPHFSAKYASLASIINASREALAKNNLSILQNIKREGDTEFVVTTLLHSSGQWIEDDGIPLLIDKNTMQGLGSAFTYARRYGMSSMLRIVADEDDDGNAAEKNAPKKPEPMKQAKVISKITSAPLPNPPEDPDGKLKAQKVRLDQAMLDCNWSNEEVGTYIKTHFGETKKWNQLSYDERERVISAITLAFDDPNEEDLPL